MSAGRKAEHLDTRQRNNLAVGNGLAAEIAATEPGRRTFVIVWPYHEQPRPSAAVQTLAVLVGRGAAFSKVLNADRENEGEVRYGYTVVEVEEAALATYLQTASVSYSARLERRTLASRMHLQSLEEVEAELHRHLDDLAPRDVAWRVLPSQ